MLAALDIKSAAKLLIAIPEGYDAGQIAEQARALNPDLAIIVRAHSDEEVAHLTRLGARHVIMGEREIARRMLEHATHMPNEALVA